MEMMNFHLEYSFSASDVPYPMFLLCSRPLLSQFDVFKLALRAQT